MTLVPWRVRCLLSPVETGIGASLVAVDADDEPVRGDVDRADDLAADLERHLLVLLAVDAVAGGQAVEAQIDLDVGAGRPEVLRPVVRDAVADPRPRSFDVLVGGDIHVALEELLVLDRKVERDDDRHAHADRLALERCDRRIGLLLQGERLGGERVLERAFFLVVARALDGELVLGARLETLGRDPLRAGDPAVDLRLAVGRDERGLGDRAVLGVSGDDRVDGDALRVVLDAGRQRDRVFGGDRLLDLVGRAAGQQQRRGGDCEQGTNIHDVIVRGRTHRSAPKGGAVRHVCDGQWAWTPR